MCRVIMPVAGYTASPYMLQYCLVLTMYSPFFHAPNLVLYLASDVGRMGHRSYRRAVYASMLAPSRLHHTDVRLCPSCALLIMMPQPLAV